MSKARCRVTIEAESIPELMGKLREMLGENVNLMTGVTHQGHRDIVFPDIVFPPDEDCGVVETIVEDCAPTTTDKVETPSLQELHAALTAVINTNGEEAARTIVESYGVKRVRELGEEHWADLFQDCLAAVA